MYSIHSTALTCPSSSSILSVTGRCCLPFRLIVCSSHHHIRPLPAAAGIDVTTSKAARPSGKKIDIVRIWLPYITNIEPIQPKRCKRAYAITYDHNRTTGTAARFLSLLPLPLPIWHRNIEKPEEMTKSNDIDHVATKHVHQRLPGHTIAVAANPRRPSRPSGPSFICNATYARQPTTAYQHRSPAGTIEHFRCLPAGNVRFQFAEPDR